MAQDGLPACEGLHAPGADGSLLDTGVFQSRPLIAFASRSPLEHSVMRV